MMQFENMRFDIFKYESMLACLGLPGKQVAEVKVAIAHMFVFPVPQHQFDDASGDVLRSEELSLQRGLPGCKTTEAERRATSLLRTFSLKAGTLSMMMLVIMLMPKGLL